MEKPSWKISPGTILGKWSLGLIAAMFLMFFIGTAFTGSLYKSISAGTNLPADMAARPALALAMLAGMTVGISAFITGLLAIIRQKETSLPVYVSTGIGALLALLLIGEIVFPH